MFKSLFGEIVDKCIKISRRAGAWQERVMPQPFAATVTVGGVWGGGKTSYFYTRGTMKLVSSLELPQETTL